MPVNLGIRDVSADVDDEGHRTYTVEQLIRVDPDAEGPANILESGVLPFPGTFWVYGTTDIDIWAFCLPSVGLKRHDAKPGERAEYWTATQKFTTKPVRPDRQRCNNTRIEDPLLEPQKVSGSFKSYTEEATTDRFGDPIVNSSYELIRGQVVEFDKNRPSVRIEQNVPLLQLELFAPMIDTVNDSILWGLPPRCVKLSSVTWERQFYGSCYMYYKRVLEFDIRYESFDRTIADEGTKALHGDWTGPNGSWEVTPMKAVTLTGNFTATDTVIAIPGGFGDNDVSIGQTIVAVGIPSGAVVTDYNAVLGLITFTPAADADGSNVSISVQTDPDPTNPTHYVRLKDRNGENCRVILNGAGEPWDPNTSPTGTGGDEPGSIFVQKYGESNFLFLGIPTIL